MARRKGGGSQVDPTRGESAPIRYFGPNIHMNQCQGLCRPCGYTTPVQTLEGAIAEIREHRATKQCP